MGHDVKRITSIDCIVICSSWYDFQMFAFSDGQCIAVMPPSQDHKRLLEGNTGPMTGGVGAYSPCPQVW